MHPLVAILRLGGLRLRPYQVTLVNAAEVSESRRLLIVLPTAGGKTVVFSQLTKNAVARGEVVWIIAHRQELISQASNTLTTFGIVHGIIKAGHELHPRRAVQVASVQTLVRRLQSLAPPDLIVIDECHHSVSPTYQKILSAFPRARVIGVTATPCRLSGAGLNAVFDEMILGPSSQELTDAGFLSPKRFFAPPKKADFSKVKITAGDYNVHELEEVMDKPAITGDAVEHYQRICPGVPMLTFCVSVKHAHDVAEEYRKAGYRAAAVDGKLSDEDRADRIGGLATGKYQVITSCDLIGEGLDVPVVGAVQLLRPTQSAALCLQQVGRGLRMSPGKTITWVLDHVNNIEKHWGVLMNPKWTLEGKVKKRSDKAVPTRTCEQCFSVHVVKKSCPYCGFLYPVKSKALTATKVVDGQLVEVEQTREERQEEVVKARSLGELTAIAKSRGYQRPHFWAINVLRGRRPSVNLLPYLP